MNTTDLQTIAQTVQAIDDDDDDDDRIAGKIDLTEAVKLRYKHLLSYQQIADRFNVTKQAVQQRLATISKLLPHHDEIETYRQNKSQMLDALEYKVYNEMLDPDKLKDASFNNLAYGFQNISTQNRLEKGLVTSRIESFAVTASLDDLERRKQELLKTVRCTTVQDVVPTTDNVTS